MKKTLSLVLVLLLAILCFASCSFGGGGKDPVSETMVYGKGVNTTIIVSADAGSLDTAVISDAIYEACGVIVDLRNDSFERTGSEIVVGDSTRDITASAKTAMQRALRREIIDSNLPEEEAAEDLVAYGVYAEGGSLAVIWSDDTFMDDAFDYMITKYLSGESLDSAKKISDFKVISLTEYYDALVEEQKAAEWEKMKQNFIEFGCNETEAEECVAAVRTFYAMADESVYLWIANLYDPEIGGFYYSNSARDTIGFLPDIESTLQALNILKGNGMFDDFGRTDAEKLRNAIPKEMQEKIVKFVQGCQSDVDGYFHHPQWEGMDSAWTSRLGRDLSWATGLLEWFGASPLYSLPTARGVSSEKALTDRLGTSEVSMVSKVIAVDAIPDYLKSTEAFEEYLLALDWEKSSYQLANTVGAQASVIRSRGTEFVAVLEKVFNEKQNPENGLWEDGIYYASVNGLMKSVACMNGLGIKLNYAEEAFNSAITMAKWTEKDAEGYIANHIVDVYNPWYAMDDILQNVQEHGDAETVKALRETLIDEAVELIRISMVKTAPFKKADGSFGYNYDVSPHTSQGAPVSVPGTVEGDVNGCVMALSGVIGNLLGTFGVDYARRFYINDYFRFIDEIESLGVVIKDNMGATAEYITFDDEIVGSTEIVEINTISVPSDGIGQVELKEGSDTDKVLHIKDTSKTQGTSVRMTPGGVLMGASRCVIEFDINVKSSTDGVFYQLFMGSTYQLILTSQGDQIKIGDSSTKGVGNDFGVSFKKGEWHNIRVEYYFTGDESTTITKIYLDGALRALSDNFYGKLPGASSTPALYFGEFHMYTLYEPVVDVYLDNIYSAKDNELYKEEPVVNPNFVSDFEGETGEGLAPGVTYKDYVGSANIGVVDDPVAADNDGAYGKVMHFASSGAAVFYRKAESLTNVGNAFVFEADMYFNSASSGGAITQTYFKVDGGQILALTFRAGSDSAGQYVELCTLDMSNNTARTPLAKIYLHKWTNLRIEYYRYQYEVGPDGNLWSGVKVRVLTDGTEQFNGLCDYPDPNALSKNITNFQNYVLSGKSIDMYIDNMSFYIDNLTYVDEDGNAVPDPENAVFPKGSAPVSTPADAKHNGVFDFEGAALGSPVVGGLSTSPNENEYGNVIEIAKDPEGDNALKLVSVPSLKSINGVTFEAAKNSPAAANCSVLEFTVNVLKAGGDENFLQLYMYDSAGQIIASFNILFSKGATGAVRITSRVDSGRMDSSFDYLGGDLKIRFEYYESNGMAKLFVNGSFVGEGYSSYAAATKASDVASARITALMKSAFELYIDDVTVNSIQKPYVAHN